MTGKISCWSIIKHGCYGIWLANRLSFYVFATAAQFSTKIDGYQVLNVLYIFMFSLCQSVNLDVTLIGWHIFYFASASNLIGSKYQKSSTKFVY